MNLDGSGMEIVARGVRNTVGFDFHPKTRRALVHRQPARLAVRGPAARRAEPRHQGRAALRLSRTATQGMMLRSASSAGASTATTTSSRRCCSGRTPRRSACASTRARCSRRSTRARSSSRATARGTAPRSTRPTWSVVFIDDNGNVTSVGAVPDRAGRRTTSYLGRPVGRAGDEGRLAARLRRPQRRGLPDQLLALRCKSGSSGGAARPRRRIARARRAAVSDSRVARIRRVDRGTAHRVSRLPRRRRSNRECRSTPLSAASRTFFVDRPSSFLFRDGRRNNRRDDRRRQGPHQRRSARVRATPSPKLPPPEPPAEPADPARFARGEALIRRHHVRRLPQSRFLRPRADAAPREPARGPPARGDA